MNDRVQPLNVIRDRAFGYGMFDCDWIEKPEADRWSKKEIIGHLIGIVLLNLQRFVGFCYQENFKHPCHRQPLVASRHGQQTGIKQLLSFCTQLNIQIIKVISSFFENSTEVQCDIGRKTVCLHTISLLAKDNVE